jgi:adenylyltransferase/sulfurtransferase
MKGYSFREFVQSVVPLLDGRHTFKEIHAGVQDIFEAEDLVECLELLASQGLLEVGDGWGLSDDAENRLRPQLNFFHNLSVEPWVYQQRLTASRIAVVGLTPSGVAATRALANAGVGYLRGIDAEETSPADTYFHADLHLGRLRTEAISSSLSATTVFEPFSDRLTTDATVERALEGSAFVVNCLDEGNLSSMYRLNRVCLKMKKPLINASASGFEVIVGPTVFPGETACYMCFRMRLLACAEDPEAGYDFESYLDRRKTDDTNRRANLVFGPVIAGQLAALEVMKFVSGIGEPATRGRAQVLDLRDLKSTMHVVLRKPWCPACTAMVQREANP